MDELLQEYKQTLKQTKKLLEHAPEQHKKIIRQMIADLEFVIEWLKREVIHAHKLLTEKEEECERLKLEIESWKELFEAAMADKEQLHKENLILENQIQRLREANDELKARNWRYFDDLMRLEQEMKGLRLYALQKLKIDVYGD